MKRFLKSVLIAITMFSVMLAISLVISAKDISKFSIELDNADFVYTGEDIIPALTLKDENGNEISSDNYEITYLRNGNATIDFKSAGEIVIRVDGKGEYSGSLSATYIISKALPMGAPSYTAITTGEKTLSDAKLVVGENGFNVEGTVSWMKPNDTIVEYKKEYTWVFTPSNPNYDNLSGEIKLFDECKTHTYSSSCDVDCNACGNNERIPEDHKYMEMKVVQPTDEKEGERTLECTECGYQKTEVIPIDKSLKAWQIILIIVAGVVIVAIIGLLVFGNKKKKKNAKKQKNKKRKKHWKKKK